MKRVHPNLIRALIGASFALVLGAGGCRSTSGGIAGNPFMAPDRVPPPSTRAILPGQAQPYYQGDPLPTMQSRANAPANAAAADPTDANARSSTGRTLAWNVPGNTPPTPAVPPTGAVASDNEASVAVPVDNDPLRFSLPAPQDPKNTPPIAAATPAPSQRRTQPPSVPAPQGVQLASYNAPAATSPPPAISTPVMTAPQQVSSPWRPPQVAQSTAQPSGAAPLALPPPPVTPVMQPPVAIHTNTMGVTLRAVPSPPGDATPRIRMPGYIPPEQFTAADGFRPRTSMQ